MRLRYVRTDHLFISQPEPTVTGLSMNIKLTIKNATKYITCIFSVKLTSAAREANSNSHTAEGGREGGRDARKREREGRNKGGREGTQSLHQEEGGGGEGLYASRKKIITKYIN